MGRNICYWTLFLRAPSSLDRGVWTKWSQALSGMQSEDKGQQHKLQLIFGMSSSDTGTGLRDTVGPLSTEILKDGLDETQRNMFLTLK